MTDDQSAVGKGIADALRRARALEEASTRKLRIRLAPISEEEGGGLRISARIAALSDDELAVQEGIGSRLVKWSDLDQRADELADLVEVVAREVSSAVNKLPPAAPVDRFFEDDRQLQEFSELVETYSDAVFRAATAVVNDASAWREPVSPGTTAEAAMIAGLRLAALAAFSVGVSSHDLVNSLQDEVVRMRSGAEKATTLSVIGKRAKLSL
ncbi:hypothetical protein C5748_10785 [Phyllobacterium phragmitis]|uniref:Uncharacterized protein n=1 Tax=Phyllobacterium phragmitis TaxID=2670329 RepID=A0A2S9IT67_9HYPH|nr:hypothetical protein [Phyllobacterium phragmitis]PRD43722.1 hypothetical protein C5748_10785 [Phyllobacterium phragmitis]